MILSRDSIRNNLVPLSKTTWSPILSSDLSLVKSENLSTSDALIEIKQLVQQLSKIDNVERVKALATEFPDLHHINFELELKPGTELSDEVWDKIQDLVIDCEWKLRDDSGEKWYFSPQTADHFAYLRDPSRVIVDSDQLKKEGMKTWSSPPLKLVVH